METISYHINTITWNFTSFQRKASKASFLQAFTMDNEQFSNLVKFSDSTTLCKSDDMDNEQINIPCTVNRHTSIISFATMSERVRSSITSMAKTVVSRIVMQDRVMLRITMLEQTFCSAYLWTVLENTDEHLHPRWWHISLCPERGEYYNLLQRSIALELVLIDERSFYPFRIQWWPKSGLISPFLVLKSPAAILHRRQALGSKASDLIMNWCYDMSMLETLCCSCRHGLSYLVNWYLSSSTDNAI